ncbi:MAG: hypothetical protein KA791_12510, partial [Flavobacteriales bacterium]|nr:hypothetical protein [Flavobacteriales bacterium]
LLPLAVGFNLNFGTLFTELDPHIYIGGDNVIFWGPLSWAVIYGLTFATFLTLIMVPVMLLIIAKIKHRRYSSKLRRKQALIVDEAPRNTLRPGSLPGEMGPATA